MVRAIFILAASLALSSLSACTAEQAYVSAQGWQRNQCGKLPDKAEFDRCMAKADTTYDSYKRETEPPSK